MSEAQAEEDRICRVGPWTPQEAERQCTYVTGALGMMLTAMFEPPALENRPSDTAPYRPTAQQLQDRAHALERFTAKGGSTAESSATPPGQPTRAEQAKAEQAASLLKKKLSANERKEAQLKEALTATERKEAELRAQLDAAEVRSESLSRAYTAVLSGTREPVRPELMAQAPKSLWQVHWAQTVTSISPCVGLCPRGPVS
eukprot:3070086-Prymnesium_polylepis.1